MTDTDRILNRVLAASDAIRLPIRDWSGHISANREAALKILPTHGVPLRVGGVDVARLTGEAQIAEAAATGLLEVRRHGRIKFPHVRLSDEGEARARALAGLPQREDGLRILRLVAASTLRTPITLDQLWLDEVALNEGRGWGFDASREDRRGLAFIEQDYLAASSAGWLTTNSTRYSHVRYAVTAAGWQEIDTPSKPTKISKLPKFEEEAEKLYVAERDAKIRDLAASKPALAGDIGTLPLGVSHEGILIRGCPR